MNMGFAAKYTCNVKPFLGRGTTARTIAGIRCVFPTPLFKSPRLDYGFKQRVISNLTGIINKNYGTLNNPHITPVASYSSDYCSMGRWKMGQNDCSSGCHKHITAINKMSYQSKPC